MRKLTDEELSRVLSMHAVGKLKHDTFGTLESDPAHFGKLRGCGCVAGAALNLHYSDRPSISDTPELRLACDISDAVGWLGRDGVAVDGFKPHYADTPEELLAYLAERGLA